MKNSNFWSLLQEKRNGLTRSGAAIADYLTEHPEEAQYLSISAMAAKCQTGDATIYRFCKQLGFSGYNEMRIALAQANAASGTALPQPTAADGTASLCETASQAFQAAVSNTLSLLSPSDIDSAALLLQRAKNVYCMGQGGSMLLANDICARLATISNKFHAVDDNHLQIIAASLMGTEDVILFVSYSGATKDMMDTLSVARESGAKIILITHYGDAPGVALADVVLLCGALEGPLDGGSIPVKVAELFVAEVLILRFSLDNQELTGIAKNRTSEALARKLL